MFIASPSSTQHVIAEANFRKRFLAGVAAFDGFLLLVRGELRGQ